MQNANCFMFEVCFAIIDVMEKSCDFDLHSLRPLNQDRYWKLNNNFLALDDVESFVIRLI
jgi:hypothetical protein